MYGAGVEHIGREGRPERFPVPEPQRDQLLVRVDAVGMCYSDVKLIKQGGGHPKLYGRDLATQPTRLGHEVALTVMRVGADLRERFHPGQRLALQPDIYRQGRSTAYGYTIPGGLTQFHLIGPEVLDADQQSYLLPIAADLGYAAAALTEPWACVEAAYTQRRRLAPRPGGTMWIAGRGDSGVDYAFSAGLEAPSTIVLSDVPQSLLAAAQRQAHERGARLVRRDGVSPAGYPALNAELAGDAGFDDIVLLDPSSAQTVSAAAALIARRGTLNLVGQAPLDGLVPVDIGRIHYDYTAYVGNRGPDIAASYGERRNRCELRAGGTALLVGAGGPMGQMHVQRAIELAAGPGLIVASEVNPTRLADLEAAFAAMAQAHGKRLLTFNPAAGSESLRELIARQTGGRGADDVIVCAPVASLAAEAAAVMAGDGMLVLFAGCPNGTLAPLDLSRVYLHNAQYTGTSGSTVADQALVIAKAGDGRLSPERSVAAIGGIEAAQEGVRALLEGRYPGKVVIFPQLTGLPLLGLAELEEALPSVAACLAPGSVWTREAERALIERFWQP